MPATGIVGAQWGDEGKGKIVDLLAKDSEVVCRYQGGPNAGHTIILGRETFALHHIRTVNSSRCNSDQHFTRAWLWNRLRLQL